MRGLIAILTLVQILLGARVLRRFVSTAQGSRIQTAPVEAAPAGRVTVILPVLNEIDRVGPCLSGLRDQHDVVAEVLVVDGGSSDGTQALVERAMPENSRIRLVDASPVPEGVNGKAWGLQVGLDNARSDTTWILTVDADVRLSAALAESLVVHAEREDVPVLSAATTQKIAGPALGMLHPSLLTTLVYRFGIPGSVTTDVRRVQANGQCFLIRRDVLEEIGTFRSVLGSVCEDVTLARRAAAAGYPVGFHETDHLASVEMHSDASDAWRNWTRSLPVRDSLTRWSSLVGSIEVVTIQALPLWILPLALRRYGKRHLLPVVNSVLVMTRIGVLAGTSRAYPSRPWTYALSPLMDLPVALQIIRMSFRRNHIWRGREFSPGVTE